jgi:hypothetical protein
VLNLRDGYLKELTRDQIQTVWNRRPRVLLRRQGMFVLDAFKNHLTLEVRFVIHAMNADFVVITVGMTS